MRKTIATRLTQAVTVPHFYLTVDVNIDSLLVLREEANRAAPKDVEGTPVYKVSINDFIVRGLALALRQVPEANAIWAGDRILKFRRSDIGVAVALDGGLITPVIRQAEQKTLSEISNEVKELAESGSKQKAQADRLSGRFVGHFESRDVWGAGIHRHYKSTSLDDLCRRCRASSSDRNRGR